MKHVKFKIDMYEQHIDVVLCEDCANFSETLTKKFKLTKTDWSFSGMIYTNSDNHHVVMLNHKFGTEHLLSTIVHESFHLSNIIMRSVGIKPDLNNDEAQAYLLTYIFENIKKLLKL